MRELIATYPAKVDTITAIYQRHLIELGDGLPPTSAKPDLGEVFAASSAEQIKKQAQDFP